LYSAAVPSRQEPADTLDRLRGRILEGPGQLEASIRRAAFLDDLDSLPDPMAAYVDKVHRHAYEMTDQDTEALRDAGLSEDQIFELTVAAAVGAGLIRFDLARGARSGNGS
jgi:alkylhydroperoxidase family enzyme